MATIRVYSEGTVSGTGSTNLTTDAADSRTTVDAGQTLQFDTLAQTQLEVDDTKALGDTGTTGFITTPTTIDGNSVGPADLVELNYAFLTEDPSGELFTIWVFSYGSNDGNQFYIISEGGTPTRDGDGLIETVTPSNTDYVGQSLTVLDTTSLTTGALTDTAMNDFMNGDGSLTFQPENDDIIDLQIGQITNVVPCFTNGALISTPIGPRPVEDLRRGDLVLTKDNGAQTIRWIGSRRLSRVDLLLRPNLRPIRIRAGALGQGMPQVDLLVSPQHRMLVQSKIAKRMFDTTQVLVAAKNLLPLQGVCVEDNAAGVDYFHFLFDTHEVVWANGAQTESLFLGPEALKGVGAEARAEIVALFPELERAMPQPAAKLVNGQQAQRLSARHQKNRQPLLAPS